MLVAFVLLVPLLLVPTALIARVVVVLIRRRRREPAMYVPTFPLIELEQPYGGWDADASDGYTGHGMPRLPLIARVGPPSTWGRLP